MNQDPSDDDALELTCPTCGDLLDEVHATRPTRFRCAAGHDWPATRLQKAQLEAAIRGLWQAIRAFEGSADLSSQLARRESVRHHTVNAVVLQRQAQAALRRSAQVRAILAELTATPTEATGSDG
jgi:hypothetical protein